MVNISICIPTFNGARFIESAIKSVLNQTYEDFTLVVVDDFSTDNTFEIINCIHDQRLHRFRNQTRKGLVGNWNECIKQSDSEFIQILHQDDLMDETYLENTIWHMRQNPEVGFLFSNMDLIDENNLVIGSHWNSKILPPTNQYLKGEELFDRLLNNGNWIPCSSVMAKRKCFQEWGLFNDKLTYTPDYEMWLRLSLHTDAFFMNTPKIKIRRHSDQVSHSYAGLKEEAEECWKAIQIVFSEQKNFIHERDKKIRKSLNFLIDWSFMNAKERIRKFNVGDSIPFLQIMSKFYLYKLFAKNFGN